MNSAQARYVRITLQQRALFIRKAEPAVDTALTEQLEPIFHIGVLHPIGTEVDHLIHPEPLIQVFKAIYTDVAYHFGKATYSGLLAGKKSMRFKNDSDFEDNMDEAIDNFINTVSAKMIVNITEATREEVKEFLKNNVSQGRGAADLATALRKHFTDFNRMRSLRIARTEVGRASNFAGHTASKMLDFELTKTWLHAGNTNHDRPDHIAASGQTVPNNDEFDIDSDYAPMFPQDGSGGADEEVNCNCVVYRTRVKEDDE